MRRSPFIAFAVASALLLTGCGGTADPVQTPSNTPSEAPSQDVLSGELVIYAAASLTAAFTEIAEAFALEHPGVDVLPIRFDGSPTLATQILEGAAVDVFATADERNMATVTDAGLATGAALFATNTLVVAVPVGNPGGVTTLADLADPALDVALCAPEVPCGAASLRLLEWANLTVVAATLEQNVKGVLTKVELGEADAGLVYATDVVGVDVESFVPEGADEIVNRYPIVALTDAPNSAAAQAFVAFVLGPQGTAILATYGFGAP